jgi:hypothetical protein
LGEEGLGFTTHGREEVPVVTRPSDTVFARFVERRAGERPQKNPPAEDPVVANAIDAGGRSASAHGGGRERDSDYTANHVERMDSEQGSILPSEPGDRKTRPASAFKCLPANGEARPPDLLLLRRTKRLPAATPVAFPKDDLARAYEGRTGGVLWAASAADGRKLLEYRLDAPPAWDSLAATEGHL